MIDELFDPDNFEEWLEMWKPPGSLKGEAQSAIDAFGEFLKTKDSSSLETLYVATCHSRSEVWEVGLPLLARLAEQFEEVKFKIEMMTVDAKAEVRRRSIQYITDRYSKSFCITVLTRLLRDRSPKVRDFAASRITYLNLREMLPELESAMQIEANPAAHYGMTSAIRLMRDGYFFDDHPEHKILWLYYPELFPAATPWVREAQLRWENGDTIEVIKSETLRAHPDFNLCRRAWEWPDEQVK